jgi:hypothetical protein
MKDVFEFQVMPTNESTVFDVSTTPYRDTPWTMLHLYRRNIVRPADASPKQMHYLDFVVSFKDSLEEHSAFYAAFLDDVQIVSQACEALGKCCFSRFLLILVLWFVSRFCSLGGGRGRGERG